MSDIGFFLNTSDFYEVSCIVSASFRVCFVACASTDLLFLFSRAVVVMRILFITNLDVKIKKNLTE